MAGPSPSAPETAGSGRPFEPEPSVSLAPSSGKVVVELPGLDALFDSSGSLEYPHFGHRLERSVANFLIRSVRARGRQPKAKVEVVLPGPPRTSAQQDAARAEFHRFFANEEKMALLDIRVNRVEGVAAIRYSVPFVILAGVVAGIAGTTTVVARGGTDILALVYLAFITIVWVMLWDPIEMLLFDSYILRLRRRAIRKLASADLSFSYRPAASPALRDEPSQSQ